MKLSSEDPKVLARSESMRDNEFNMLLFANLWTRWSCSHALLSYLEICNYLIHLSVLRVYWKVLRQEHNLHTFPPLFPFLVTRSSNCSIHVSYHLLGEIDGNLVNNNFWALQLPHLLFRIVCANFPWTMSCVVEVIIIHDYHI